MRRFVPYAFGLGTVALLAACGESQPLPIGAAGAVPALTSPLMRNPKLPRERSPATDHDYKVSPGLLYVALSDVEAPYDKVNIYNTREKNPTVLAAITDGVSYPQSACIDGNGTLYVTNQGSGAGWVSEYPLGKTKPSTIITNGISGPGFCAIDADGNLWVTNVYTPDVVEYEKGSTLAHMTITKGISYPIGIAIDHFGNLYVVNHNGPSETNVVVYPPRHTSPARTITDGVTWPCGIGVDARATLYVTNITPGNVEEYQNGQSHPRREITKDMNGPAAVTFAKDGWFYVTNIGAQGGGSGPGNVVLEFARGSIAPSKKEISKDLYLPFGTAYYPALLP